MRLLGCMFLPMDECPYEHLHNPLGSHSDDLVITIIITWYYDLNTMGNKHMTRIDMYTYIYFAHVMMSLSIHVKVCLMTS